MVKISKDKAWLLFVMLLGGIVPFPGWLQVLLESRLQNVKFLWALSRCISWALSMKQLSMPFNSKSVVISYLDFVCCIVHAFDLELCKLEGAVSISLIFWWTNSFAGLPPEALKIHLTQICGLFYILCWLLQSTKSSISFQKVTYA